MTERLLQFIWQYRYFNQENMEMSNGEPFHIIHPGHPNTNQGPDFLEARIRAGNTLLVGHVELHLKTSCWNRHAHQHDPNYGNVVLHVVWEDDSDGEKGQAPVFSLAGRVSTGLLQRYEAWMMGRSFIPCEQQFSTVNNLVVTAWKDRLLVSRLERKTKIVLGLLEQNNHHWDETFYRLLARSFGNKVNAEAFEAIARSIPLNLLAKHKPQLLQLEALFIGQAGLLNRSFVDEYPNLLRREYRFYRVKYGLKEISHPVHFLRMRPVSFPTLRLAQLAGLLHSSTHLFSLIRESTGVQAVKELLNVKASEYWDYHYTFSEVAAFKPKRLGEQAAEQVLINTVIPVLFAYGHYHGEDIFKEKAIQWLGSIQSERNTITAGFGQLGIPARNALDSQAMIELKTAWCDQKKCLQCAIGNAILQENTIRSPAI